jgi:type I restriction enzyme, S subunit
VTILPKRWALKPFGEIAVLQRGYDLPVQERRSGNVPVFAANGTVGTHCEAKVTAPGVVTGRSGSIGRVHFVSGDFWPLNTALYVRDFRGNDPEWVAELLRWMHLERFARGGAVPTLNRNLVHAESVPCPPLDEQCRIVVRIKECVERMEEIEQLDVALDLEVLALFPALLNEQFRRLALVTDRKRLDRLADIRGGASLPKGYSIDSGSKSVLLLKVGDMNEIGNERVIASSRAYLPIAQAGRGVINAGATIFPKRGGAIATNKKRLLGRPALLDPNLMAIEPLDDQVLSSYLYYWSLTLDLRVIAGGAIIPQLNRKDLAPLQLPVPDREVQEVLVTELEEAEAVCAELAAQVQASQGERASLREAILRRAFSGEL